MQNKKLGTLFFIPVTLGEDNFGKVLPSEVISIAQQLDEFIVENEKVARHFLATIKHPKPIRELVFKSLNEHTLEKDLPNLITSLLGGKNVGLMSDAGCPGIADPGAKVAALAHAKGIRVAPLVGPSSILLSLMASGLNGQNFAFLGYLPVERNERILKLREIEKQSHSANQTQVFIETPYRNNQLLESILDTCLPNTYLCIASHISLSDEYIVTKKISEWKKSERPDLHKKPTIFLLLSKK